MDFIFKKSVLLWLNLQFFFYNMFVEKYYVEFLFLRVKDYSAACVRIIDLYAREFAFSALAGFLIIVFILILCF